jgi:hypothetical protein
VEDHHLRAAEGQLTRQQLVEFDRYLPETPPWQR